MTQVNPSTITPGFGGLAPPAIPGLWAPADNLLRPQWASGIGITTAWDTSVAGAKSVSEQRKGQRGRPVRTVEYPFLAMNRQQSHVIGSYQRRLSQTRGLFPIWPDVTTLTGGLSGAVIPCDTTLRRLFTGGNILICKPASVSSGGGTGLWESVRPARITAVASDSLTIAGTGTVLDTIAAGDRVVPAIEARLVPSSEMRLLSDRIGDGVLLGVESVGASALPGLVTAGTTPSGYNEYLGYPILTLPVRTPIDSTWGVVRNGQHHPAGLGSVHEFYGDRGRVAVSLPLTFITRSSAWDFLRFFDSRAGRLYPFWLVDPRAEYELDGFTSTTLMRVKHWADDYDWNYKPYIAVWMRDGTIYIRGATIFDIGGPVDTVQLDAALPSIDPVNVARVTGAYLMRFDRDELTETWINTGAMQTAIDAVELLEEKSVTISNLTDIETADLADTFDVLVCEGEAIVPPPDPDPVPCDTISGSGNTPDPPYREYYYMDLINIGSGPWEDNNNSKGLGTEPTGYELDTSLLTWRFVNPGGAGRWNFQGAADGKVRASFTDGRLYIYDWGGGGTGNTSFALRNYTKAEIQSYIDADWNLAPGRAMSEIADATCVWAFEFKIWPDNVAVTRGGFGWMKLDGADPTGEYTLFMIQEQTDVGGTWEYVTLPQNKITVF